MLPRNHGFSDSGVELFFSACISIALGYFTLQPSTKTSAIAIIRLMTVLVLVTNGLLEIDQDEGGNFGEESHVDLDFGDDDDGGKSFVIVQREQ